VRCVELVLVFVLVAGERNAAKGASTEIEVPKRLAEDAQLVSDELQVALTDKRAEFRDCGWPRDIEKVKVDRSRVPDEVLRTTSRWLGTMIKSKYLPKDPNNWLIPIRKAKAGSYLIVKGPDGSARKTHIPEEGFDDYLVARYSVGVHTFQIQEGRSAVCLLIDVNDASLSSPKVEQFTANVLYEFLNYPEAKRNGLTFNLRSFEHAGQEIWFGTVDCDFNLRDNGANAKRSWWSHTFMWTDGRRVYFSLVEMSGQPKEGGRKNAKPGSPPRFK
jgi:hypothetical protein